MKLLLCRSCQDMVKLATSEVRHCHCKRCSGHYLEDGHNAEVWGREAEVIAIGNTSLIHALKSEDLTKPALGLGPDIRAWLFPHNYFRITRHGEAYSAK